MVDDTEDGVEGACKCLVSINERSGNLRKDLKKEILEAVSSLRQYFIQVKTNLESKREANKTLELEVRECKEEIQRLRNRPSTHKGQVAPSIDTERMETVTECQGLTPTGRDGKLYSDAVERK
jgi:hypothetical protein